MAIQSRRGSYKDLVKSKLLDAEWAIVLDGDTSTNDGKSVYVCLGSGIVKRVVMEDEIVGLATDTYVDSKTNNHNKDSLAHADMRNQLSELKNRLNTIANSDDLSLDQLQEIVTYIKNNKSLIDSITTSKVNVSDIVSNLITNTSSKPLSASMGVELKRLIDSITVPTNLSQLNNDSKFAKSTEVAGAVNQHDVSSASHFDIRKMVQDLDLKLKKTLAVGKFAEVGKHSGAWAISTSYKDIGNILPIVDDELFKTVAGSSRIVIKKKGMYLVTCNCTCNNAVNPNDKIWLKINKNGQVLDTNTSHVYYDGCATYSRVISANAGDYIDAELAASTTDLKSRGNDVLQVTCLALT